MIDYDLKKIKAVIFDVDGVLSAETIGMDDDGQPLRTINIKVGYAIQLAVKMGLRIAIITGGKSPAIAKRYAYLGVEDIYMGVAVKVDTYEDFLRKYRLVDKEVIFMGDDIPDLECMREVGIPVCPADAASEVIEASRYVSEFRGGEGAVRDIVEQVLRARGDWARDSMGVTPSSLVASR